MSFWPSHVRTIVIVAWAAAAVPACERGQATEGEAAPQGAPECEAYASDYERCVSSIAPNPDVAAHRSEATRQTLAAAAAKDPASLDRLNERCRTAREQLRTACQ
jgi:hypothetical protein